MKQPYMPLSAALAVDDLTVRLAHLRGTLATGNYRGKALENERELIGLLEQTLQAIVALDWED